MALSPAISGSRANHFNRSGSLFPHLYKGDDTHFLYCTVLKVSKEGVYLCSGKEKNAHSPTNSSLLFTTFPSLPLTLLSNSPPSRSPACPAPTSTLHVSRLCVCPQLPTAGSTLTCEYTTLSCALSFVFRSSVHFIFPSDHEQRGSSFPFKPGTPPELEPPHQGWDWPPLPSAVLLPHGAVHTPQATRPP